MKTTPQRLISLGSRGIAHFLAPLVLVLLVGIGGTYLLVASHADAKTGGTEAKTAPAGKKAKTGYLVLYGASDADQVKIVASNVDKTVKCGGTLTAAKSSVVKKINTPKNAKTTPRLKFACTPVNGNGQYQVYFGKDNKFTTARYVALDVDAGYCVIVHPTVAGDTSQQQVRKVSAGSNSSCNVKDPAPAVKLTPTLRVLPAYGNEKNSYVELAVPGKDLVKGACTGQVSVHYEKDGKTATYRNALKYTKPKGIDNGYCVASITKDLASLTKAKTKADLDKTYTVNASFAGSVYFNSATASATVKPIIIIQ
jgi:hypothetical protein